MSLAKRAAGGAAWTIASSVGSRIFGVVGTLILTRYLAPEVVGEVAAAFVLVQTAKRLTSIGFGQYVVATPDLGPAGIFQITILNFFFGLLGLSLLLVLAEPISPLFDAPGMVEYLPGLVLAALIDRVGVMPERLLARELRFRPIGMVRAGGEVIYATVAVSLAAGFDFGGEAIVWANVARSVLGALVFVALVKRNDWLRPSRFDRELVSDVFRFGAPLWVSSNANFGARTWDNLLFSSFFGPHSMGAYNLAYNLASIPSIHIGEHIGDVLVPSFSRMDDQRKRRALVRATGLMALIIFPLAVGLGAIADTLVEVLLNEEWQLVAPYLMLLSILSVVRPVSWIINSYMQSRRLTRPLMFLGIGNIIFLLSSVSGFALLGDLWACVGVGVAFALHALVSMLIVQRIDGLRVTRLLSAMAGPALACLPLYGAVLLIRELGLPPALGLGAEIAGGAVAYVIAALLVARATSRDFVSTVKKTVSRG